MERHGHLTLDPNVQQLLLAVSPATIDRLLGPIRGTAGHRRKRKLTSKSSREIPVRTFANWKEPTPGFLEIDFVAHGGDSMQGTFLWSLVATDVCSGWTEAVALVAREQSLVVEGLEVIRRQLPVPVLGIDSDNDSAFINETLQGYCKDQGIEFTRSRPYQKNDQAWIEQKNGSVIRRFVGDRRFSGLIAGQCLTRLYRMVRLHVNYFQPSFKLRSKSRDGAKIKKRYHKPATPCERLLAHASVSDASQEVLRTGLAPLDPAGLLHQIREGQAALAALSSGDLSHGPERQSLEEFLAKLPELWREGEVRPTHRKAPSSPRTWRTRKDPFEEVWPEILLWLQHDPDSTAKSLKDLHRAFVNFFEKRTRCPRFKSRKRDKARFRIPQRVKVASGRVDVPKVGHVRIRQSRTVEGATKSATFRREADGHWYVSLVVEFEMPDAALPAPNPGKVVGIDLGLIDFATTSDDADPVPAPKFFRKGQRKLRKAQRALSRRQKGSKRKAKARLRVAKVHQRISNQRGDFLVVSYDH